MKTRTSSKWCRCGHKIKGKNHNEGTHHCTSSIIVAERIATNDPKTK